MFILYTEKEPVYSVLVVQFWRAKWAPNQHWRRVQFLWTTPSTISCYGQIKGFIESLKLCPQKASLYPIQLYLLHLSYPGHLQAHGIDNLISDELTPDWSDSWYVTSALSMTQRHSHYYRRTEQDKTWWVIDCENSSNTFDMCSNLLTFYPSLIGSTNELTYSLVVLDHVEWFHRETRLMKSRVGMVGRKRVLLLCGWEDFIYMLLSIPCCCIIVVVLCT